jgi:hypothetical protein
MKHRPTNIDDATGERYLASPGRLAFMRRLAKRLAVTEFAADDPSRKGKPVNHTYSLTAERNRYVFRSPIA